MNVTFNRKSLQKVTVPEKKEKLHTILIVDDDPLNLDALSLLLDKDYNVLTADSGEDALSLILNDHDPCRISVIITDQRMPGITGTEFLRETISIIPKTIRILLTAYADIQDVIKSINEGHIYQFLTKPIEPQSFLTTIKRSLESYQLEIENMHLIKELKQLNESLEQKVKDRTFQLEESLRVLQKQKEELEYLDQFKDKLVDELRHFSLTDPLTGLSNRRTLEVYADTEWLRGVRTKKELSILMIDIDHFKLYNDFYGHAKGDHCISTVAQIIKSMIKRSSDLVARYGGEEFCCILPETNLDGAVKVASDIVNQMNLEKMPHEASPSHPHITLSIGIFSIVPNHKSSWRELLDQADKHLYRAKHLGRNQICFQ
jgi:diguanylate cyclase (GGDEF)-like protein